DPCPDDAADAEADEIDGTQGSLQTAGRRLFLNLGDGLSEKQPVARRSGAFSGHRFGTPLDESACTRPVKRPADVRDGFAPTQRRISLSDGGRAKARQQLGRWRCCRSTMFSNR